MNRATVLKNTAVSGIFKSNPIFRLVLGMCPTIAITTSVFNAIGMGLSTMFVLLCSNMLISLLRNVIPDKIRIPAYIMIVATFVTLVEMILRKFIPDLSDALGAFIPLIVVNCLILARAESFASKNPVLESAVDGLSMGLGFTFSLVLISFFRELLGSGELFGFVILGEWFPAIAVLRQPSGGFFVFAFLMVIYELIYKKIEKARKAKQSQKEALIPLVELADVTESQKQAEDLKEIRNTDSKQKQEASTFVKENINDGDAKEEK